jgi:hypothetical protein
MRLKSILCALHPLIYAASVLRSTPSLAFTTLHPLCATFAPGSTTHIYTLHASCAVSTLETRTHAAPILGVCIHPSTYIFSIHSDPFRNCSTPTLGVNTKNICRHSILFHCAIKLQLFQLILPIAIVPLRGLAVVKKKKKKERRKKRKERKKNK